MLENAQDGEGRKKSRFYQHLHFLQSKGLQDSGLASERWATERLLPSPSWWGHYFWVTEPSHCFVMRTFYHRARTAGVAASSSSVISYLYTLGHQSMESGFSFSCNETRTVFDHSCAECAAHQLLHSQDTIYTVQSFKGFGNITVPKETGKSSHKVWNCSLWCDWKGHGYIFVSEIVLAAVSEGTWRHSAVCINSKTRKILNGRGGNKKEAIMRPYLAQSSLG